MEESLRTARVIHQILIVSSAAMLIFAFSAEAPDNEYQRARQELREVTRSLPVLDEFLRSHVYRYYEEEGVVEALRAKLGAVVLKIVIPDIPEPNDLRTISEIYGYVFGIQERFGPVWRFDVESLVNEVGKRIKHRCRRALVAFKSGDGSPDTLLCSIQCDQRPYAYAIGVSAYEMSDIEDLRYEVAVSRGLIVDSQALPELRALWETVAELDPDAAERVLTRKQGEAAQSSAPRLNVFGLEMKATAAIILGPGILLALLLYLHAHLLHIRAIAAGNESLLASFPWVPLFDSKLSASLTISTLWLLPSVAASWVVYVSSLSRAYRLALGIGYVLAIGAVAFAVIWKARALNRIGGANPVQALASEVPTPSGDPRPEEQSPAPQASQG